MLSVANVNRRLEPDAGSRPIWLITVGPAKFEKGPIRASKASLAALAAMPWRTAEWPPKDV
jgi:hypothetical protein